LEGKTLAEQITPADGQKPPHLLAFRYAHEDYKEVQMIRDVVGAKNYSVWIDMLKRLVPYGRTHRLSVVVAAILQITQEISHDKGSSNTKARRLSEIFENAYEQDEENGITPLLELTEQLFQDAGVHFKRINRKGKGYSIAQEAVYQFLNWDRMPWEA